MPTFYNYTENGVVYAFDDVFVPVDAFRQGNLFTWGRGTEGQLGNNTAVNRSTPVTTFAGGANWKQVAGGSYHTAAIKTDGTLWIWGRNAEGQLGDNTSTERLIPVTTFAGGTNWKQVSMGDRYTVAIKTDGTLWTWGYNYNAQLGINNTDIRSVPVTTFAGGTNWKQVACGYIHTAAIKTDGTLWTWGNGGNGRLGTNDSTQRATPVTTFAGGANWKQVACGDYHVAAIKTDGTLWTWGNGGNGRLGDNNTSDRLTPVTTFAGGTNWKQVDGGSFHTAAIKTDGTLWTWGQNANGQLGDNTTTTRNTPVTTLAGETNWKQVTTGSSHTAAIKTNGTLWTWGRNDYGQLGTNTAINRSTPVTTFAGGTNWKQVDGGSFHTAAVTYIDDNNIFSDAFWLIGEQDSGSIAGTGSAGTFTSANITATSGGSTTLSFTFLPTGATTIDNVSYIRLYKNSSQIFEFTRSSGLTTTYSASYSSGDVFYFQADLSISPSGAVSSDSIRVDKGSSLVYQYTQITIFD
jgi:alpha-tubulin suppressor-like RCC1 family protein